MKKKWELKTFIIDTTYFVFGSILYAIAIQTFAVNANFAPGGISGLAVIVHYFTGLPIGTFTILLNIPLVIICWKILGRKFLFKSIYAMIISAFFLDFVFANLPSYDGNPFLAALFTGIFMGAGLAIIYIRGSSTGGSDFIIMAVKKKAPNFSVGQIAFAFDFIIILAGGFVYNSIDSILYGIISSYITTIVMDKILYGAGNGKTALIITTKAQQIADAIHTEIERGSTIVNAKGAYTNEEKQILYCVAKKNQIHKVSKIARTIDPDSLVTISEANEIIGNGFAQPNIPGTEFFDNN